MNIYKGTNVGMYLIWGGRKRERAHGAIATLTGKGLSHDAFQKIV